MDSNNWRPGQAEQQQAPPTSGDGGDWRSQLQPDSRHKIVNKIMETLKKYLPSNGPEGTEEIKNIAIRFEEKIHTAATSQSDYLRKISIKMLTMESKSQSTLPNPVPSNSSGVSRNHQEPVPLQNMQSQVHNQGQSVPLQMGPNQSQSRQLLAQNMQNNLASSGMQTSASLPNSLPAVSGLTQNPMSSAAARNPNMQNISGISQSSMGNTMNQGAASNLFTNAQRQMQGRQQQQQVGSQQQAQMSQNPQQYMYPQQLQQQMMKQKLQQGNMQQPLMQQANQLHNQSSSSIQHPSQSLLQQHQQSVIRQQQQPQQTPVIQQAQILQQQFIGKQANTGNMQQNQLIGQQSNISDMQQQRMLGQQNNLPNLQSQQQTNNNQNLQHQHLVGQQSNLSNMHQQQQLGHQSHVGGFPQQQQKMIGSQSGTNGMATNSVYMMQQQSKALGQQQQPQSSASLLPGGGQQPQQQLMSQSQPRQLQQQLSGLQQQTNALQHSMQQRMQAPNSILQQQNMIDQRKHLFQSERTPTEAPSDSLDSTAETGETNAGDWQEETYQKVKVIKDMYFTDLNEMYHKISAKLQQHDALPQPSKTEQLEKLRMFKTMVEKLLHFLQTPKNNIVPSYREKLPQFEKQIIQLLNSQRPRRPVPPMPQGQILSPQLQTMQQSQLPNAQSHDSGANPQLQSMNLQGSVPTMQENNMSGLHNMGNTLQPGSSLSSGQGNGHNSMQQVANAPQHGNMASPQTQSGINLLQQNINPLLSNSTMLQNQQQMLKQQLHNRNIQQQLMQKQQQQQLHLQAKQQQSTPVQAHQLAQLNQVNDINDVKMRQGLGPRSGAFPQHLSSAQRYAHQQMKPGASFPNTSPMLHGMSPQVDQHSSPQIDQQNLPPSVPKIGTPLQSANSPFIPSPSTSLAPSPMPGDSEKPVVSPLSNTNFGSIGTPGISASPFLECAGQDGIVSTAVTGKSGVTEQPIERLLKAVKSISPKALSASVCDIASVVTMIDRIAGSAPGNSSRATVGEDLVAMTKCRLQARSFLTQDGITGAKRMRRHTSAMPLNVASSVGSMSDSFMQLSELESTATSSIKKAGIEVNHALMEEIREINARLIDTVVDISNEDVDPSGCSEGTIVKCSFGAISLSPNLKANYFSAHTSQIKPLRLLVPANYPNCSPVFLDKLPVDVSKDDEDLLSKAKSKLSMSLRSVSEPMTLKEIATTWDNCARDVISEFAQKNGGGTFSSKYGSWENCLTAASS